VQHLHSRCSDACVSVRCTRAHAGDALLSAVSMIVTSRNLSPLMHVLRPSVLPRSRKCRHAYVFNAHNASPHILPQQAAAGVLNAYCMSLLPVSFISSHKHSECIARWACAAGLTGRWQQQTRSSRYIYTICNCYCNQCGYLTECTTC
jgi:hypothetical protein